MKIDVYVSKKNSRKFVSVPANTNLANLNIASVDESMTPTSLKIFKKALNIEPGQHLIAMNPDEIINQIEKNGFALHGAAVQVTEHLK